MSNLQRSLHILLFEDNPADVFIFQEALKAINHPNQLKSVEDGIEGTAYLKREGEYAYALPPDLIILDLNMPRKDGYEVLKETKTNPTLKEISVAILSNSQSPKDREICEEYPRCRFFSKPATFPRMVELVKELLEFAMTTENN